MAHDSYAALRAFNEWPDAFSADELDAIVACGESLLSGPDGANGPVGLRSEVAPSWLPARLAGVIENVNEAFYRYDLNALAGPPRYHRLRPGHTEDTDWRRELTADAVTTKLCLRLQLSDPAAFDGGDIELRGVAPVSVPRRRGLLVAFPSYYRYRVTPVRSGEARLLAVDVAGPAFR